MAGRVRELLTSHVVVSVFWSATLPRVFYRLVMGYFGVQTSNAMYVIDFIGLAYLSSVFILFQKKPRLAVVPFVFLASLVFWSASYKYAVMGLWVRAGDLSIIDEAWEVLSLLQQFSLLSVVVLIIGVSLYNFRVPRFPRLSAFLGPALLVVLLSYSYPASVMGFLRNTTNALYGNDPLYRSASFALGFDLLERWNFDREAKRYLSHESSSAANEYWPSEIENQRNVHMIVMESLMDPFALDISLPVDPMDKRFRQRIGGSALAPVIAGRSAQTEFEVLCGTPVYDFLDPVTFNDLRGGPIPCLPRVLADMGYLTVSSTDVRPNFFNAQEAYRSIGFSSMYFRGDIPTDDLDGAWVSADAHTSFNKTLIQPLIDTGQPFLNYIFLTTGHVPFALNPEKRPPLIATSSTDEVTRFVNTVYYNTRSIADYIEHLLEVDAEAIIVIVGDHQGALRSIGRAHSGADEFERYLTPYVFIDSGRARFEGDLAHYEIPRMVIASLAETEFIPLASTYGVDLIRPLGNMSFYSARDVVGSCPNETDRRCQDIDEFRSASIARWLRLIQQSKSE
jgi:hypothetical protein